MVCIMGIAMELHKELNVIIHRGTLWFQQFLLISFFHVKTLNEKMCLSEYLRVI